MAEEVFCIEEETEAWNIDGSSDAQADSGSWLQYAEASTGRKRGLCSFQGCRNRAEVGGHVWVKRIGCCIAPICKVCNRHNNQTRMQGSGACLRRNIEVTKTAMTAGMRTADRRVAMRRAAAAKASSSVKQTAKACYRCGRPGHYVQQCYAQRHVSGKRLEES